MLGCYLSEVIERKHGVVRVYLILAFNRPEKFRRKPCPIVFTPQAVTTPYGAVVRIVVRIIDDPREPLSCETFLNPLDPKDQKLYGKLITQDSLPIVIKVLDKHVDALEMTFTEKSAKALKLAWETALKYNIEHGIKQVNMVKAKEFIMELFAFP